MTYKAGLIGLSNIGARHGKAYNNTEGVELVAVADLDDDLRAERGEEWNIDEDRRYPDHEAMLERENPDVVSVATPSFLHHNHVLDVVESTADPDVVWSEKPIALSVSDANEMTNACQQAGTELVIDHMRRFSDAYVALQRLIQEENLLGDVESVHVQSGEELLRNGTHTVDLITYLLDIEATHVTGYLTDHYGMPEEIVGRFDDYPDHGGAGTIVAEDGTYVSVDHSTPRETSAGDWLFVGTEGKLAFNEIEGRWDYWRLEDGDHVEAELPEPLGEMWSIQEMFDGGAKHVVKLLDGTAENLSPGEDATHVLEILIGMFISHYTDATVELPLVRPLEDVTVTSN